MATKIEEAFKTFNDELLTLSRQLSGYTALRRTTKVPLDITLQYLVDKDGVTQKLLRQLLEVVGAQELEIGVLKALKNIQVPKV